MPLNFESHGATLNHLNVRKEGPEEAPEVAVDLKLSCEATGAILKELLGADDQPEFWRDNEERDVLYSGLSEVTTWGIFDNHELKYGGLRFSSAKLHKFKFRPIAGGLVDLEFSASVKGPTDREVNLLVEMLKEECRIEVSGPPDLFDQDAA